MGLRLDVRRVTTHVLDVGLAEFNIPTLAESEWKWPSRKIPESKIALSAFS